MKPINNHLTSSYLENNILVQNAKETLPFSLIWCYAKWNVSNK